MNFYSIFSDKQFIGVVCSNDFRVLQNRHKILLPATELDAQYVVCDDKLYHATWMQPTNGSIILYEVVDLIEISEDEYNQLKKAIDNDESIDVQPPEDKPVEPDIEPDLPDDERAAVLLEIVKNSKIQELSTACNQVIENGMDVVLNNNVAEHFSLTTQDQLNLITLSQMAESGIENIPYHADGEICRFYSAADMLKIIQAATAHKIYHTTYFNALKNYVNALEDAPFISTITYGIELPEEYQSDVLKSLINE